MSPLLRFILPGLSHFNPPGSYHFFFLMVLALLFFNHSGNDLFGQKINESYQLHIYKTELQVIIDGRMDEPAWQSAEVATDFFMITPMDTSYAELQTDVRMTYDDENLYIIAINYRLNPGDDNVVASLRRDFSFGVNDNFIFFLDTFDDQTNGFSFGANAAGAEWDGMMYNGGSINLNWDNKWESKVVNYEDRWVFEAAIPFKSIRYNKNLTRWGVNFSRYDLTTFEKSGWAPVPRQFPSASLAFTGNLIWDEPPPPAGSNISVIPHVLGGVSHDFQEDDSRTYTRDAGLNAKIGVGSSMNIDLTINPDFSQVEVDEQIIDLDRFEIFFPERRQFFIENEDLFASFGNHSIRPFFSRRIGLDAPIRAGGRLSGQIHQNWRIGVMNMQTGTVDNTRTPAKNYSVIALKRRFSSRSNIGFLLVNQEITDGGGFSETANYDRNLGIEANLVSENDEWKSKWLILKSFSPDENLRSFGHLGSVEYSDGNWIAEWEHEYVGEDYTAKVGFVPRRGYIRANPELGHLYYPDNGWVINHGPFIQSSFFFNEQLNLTDYNHDILYRFSFRDGGRAEVQFSNNYVKLLTLFDPSGLNGEYLEIDSEHRWNSWGIQFQSGVQRSFTYGFGFRYGGYYQDGKSRVIMSDIGYRFQPFVNISLSVNYNYLDLPEPWNKADFWLIGSRVDITFSENLYLTSFTQYNEQLDNVNINTRLQWRFAPASDLFVVYTDNYLPDSFHVKNRAFLLKFTYWWNV